MEIAIQLILAGLAMGAVYGLIALGYTLIWNAVSIVNFAQGDFLMLGAFFAVGWLYSDLHLSPIVDVFVALAMMAVFGGIVAVTVYHPVRNAPQLSAIVATLGLSTLLENVAVLIWGPAPLTYPGPLSDKTVIILGAKIYGQYLLILGVLFILMIAQYLMFRFTTIGKAMRATAQDAEAARLMGIPTGVIIGIIFAYAAVLAGAGGWLVAPLFYVSANMGVKLSLYAFASSILGGFGNIQGAVIGGLILGVVQSLGAYYISSAYIDVIVFGVLFLLLVFRPQGIFGEIQLERP